MDEKNNQFPNPDERDAEYLSEEDFFSEAGDLIEDVAVADDFPAEDVDVPEIVDIPQSGGLSPMADASVFYAYCETGELPTDMADLSAEYGLEEDPESLLGPAYEEPCIPAELLEQADCGNPDDTQCYDPVDDWLEDEDYDAADAVDQGFLETDEYPETFDEEPHPPVKSSHAPNRSPRSVRKTRPEQKKGDGLLGIPHLLATIVWLLIIVAIGVTLGKALWVCAADVLAFGRENKVVTLTIVEGDTIDTIAEKLHEAGLVKYPGLFKIYAQLTDAEAEITTGSFQLNTNFDYHALVNGLSPSSASRTVVEILIPEGYNCRQIFALLEENSVCSVASLEEYAANGEFKDFWFMADLPRGDKYCLEGFLFPDTYEFYVNSTPREALGKMLLGFENRFTEDMQNQLPALNERLSAMMRANGCSEEFIASHQIGIHELVIVASMIEEEMASSAESTTIASVIYNRLTQDKEYERYLNIDAAILYALGQHKESLTAEDLKIDSPYNTYTHAGLTPTPISNPGLASLEAALNPADTKYYYYVLNPNTGEHEFTKTYEEHEKLVEKYWGTT